ncbi:MAG: hypothetical protein JJT94_17495 [Bernardetiaceae bacterium]|nr:hypothetical protein [Bernardetiaceae bacterium]
MQLKKNFYYTHFHSSFVMMLLASCFTLEVAYAQEINLNGIMRQHDKDYIWNVENSPAHPDKITLNIRAMQVSETQEESSLQLLHNGVIMMSDNRRENNQIELKVYHGSRAGGYQWRIDRNNYLKCIFDYEKQQITYEPIGDLCLQAQSNTNENEPQSFGDNYVSAEKAIQLAVEEYISHYAQLFDDVLKKKLATKIVWKNVLEDVNKINTENFDVEIGIVCPADVENVELWLNDAPLDDKLYELTPAQDPKSFVLKGKVYCLEGENRVEIRVKDKTGKVVKEIRHFLYQDPKNTKADWIEPYIDNITIAQSFFNLQACIEAYEAPQKIDIFVNNVLIKSSQKIEKQQAGQCSYVFKDLLQLRNGENKIQLKFVFANAEIESETRTIHCKAEVAATQDTPPPTIHWLTPTDRETSQESDKTEIFAEACMDIAGSLTNIEVLLDGKPLSESYWVLEERSTPHCNYNLKITLAFQAQTHKIEIKVANQGGEKLSEERIINYTGQIDIATQQLPFLLSWRENYNSPLHITSNVFLLEACLQSVHEPQKIELFNNSALQQEITNWKARDSDVNCNFVIPVEVRTQEGVNNIELVATSLQGKEERILIQILREPKPQETKELNTTTEDTVVVSKESIAEVVNPSEQPKQTLFMIKNIVIDGLDENQYLKPGSTALLKFDIKNLNDEPLNNLTVIIKDKQNSAIKFQEQFEIAQVLGKQAHNQLVIISADKEVATTSQKAQLVINVKEANSGFEVTEQIEIAFEEIKKPLFEWIALKNEQKCVTKESHFELKLLINSTSPIQTLLLMQDGNLLKGNVEFKEQSKGVYMVSEKVELLEGSHNYSFILLNEQGQQQSQAVEIVKE